MEYNILAHIAWMVPSSQMEMRKMAVYAIIDIKVTDPQAYAEYVEKVPQVIMKYGGRYLARGGKITPMGDNWDPERIVLIEFPSFEHAKNWMLSQELVQLTQIRQKSTIGRAIIVEGCEPDGSESRDAG
jgi:uncharacterized protein (DUF1330 family)